MCEFLTEPRLAVALFLKLEAWVDGQLCGQSQTKEVDGQTVYAVDVVDEEDHVGCGTPGRRVTFRVDSRDMRTDAAWDSAWFDELALEPARQGMVVYLPLVLRR